jgi:lysophospholipase L1-like esterase
MMWDNDWEDFHFNDYTHMSKEGEVLFANKLIQRLSPLLEAK